MIRVRPGIDDEPSDQTRAICGEHSELIVELARTLRVTRATILRSIVDGWAKGVEGQLAKATVAKARALRAAGVAIADLGPEPTLTAEQESKARRRVTRTHKARKSRRAKAR